MSKDRKETFVKSTVKRRASLKNMGKKRLDTYVDNETLKRIDDIKRKTQRKTRGDVIDSILIGNVK